MNDGEKFDACMRIAEASTDRRKNRQDYEWRFTIAFWTLIVAAIFNSKNMSFFHGQPQTRMLVAGLALATYMVLWLYGVHRSHDIDRRLGKHYLMKAISILENEKIAKASVALDTRLSWWGAWFQACVTTGLLIVFWLSD